MTIFEKLSAIQAELKAPKNQRNNFGNYNYRSCEDILEAVKPICQKNRTVLSLYDELVNIGDRYYIKATAHLIDIETAESIITTAYAREEEEKKGMDGSQITGASSSYARKYALNGLFCIDDSKDSDFTNTGDKPAQKKQWPDSVVEGQPPDGQITHRCSVCGAEIPENVAIYSSQKFKRKLCMNC